MSRPQQAVILSDFPSLPENAGSFSGCSSELGYYAGLAVARQSTSASAVSHHGSRADRSAEITVGYYTYCTQISHHVSRHSS